MTSSTRSTSGACAALTAMILGGAATPALGQDALWRPTGNAIAGQARVTATAPIDIDRGAILAARVGDSVVIPLIDGTGASGLVNRRTDRGPQGSVVSGTLRGNGSFTVAINGGAVYGHVRAPGLGLMRVRGNVGAAAAIELIDANEHFTCSGPTGGLDFGALPHPGGGVAGACGDSVIDIIVLYTPDARDAAGGVGAIDAAIATSVEDNNIAWANSGVLAEQSLVLTWGVDISGGDLTLGRLLNPGDGWVDEAHELRALYGADQVVAIVPGFFGVAAGLFSLTPDQTDNMFCIVGYDVFPEQVFAHEQGHNMGCCHAIGDGGGCGVGLLFPYSNGHRFFGDSGTQWRTVMAYPPGDVILNFSSPLIEHDGEPTGIADEADNALTLQASHAYVADFVCPGPCDGAGQASDGPDCNENGIPDACDIASGASDDTNGNGIPDDCEDPCDADVNGDGDVDVSDLVAVILAWGPCAGCDEDIDGSGMVDVTDLVAVILAWGLDCS